MKPHTVILRRAMAVLLTLAVLLPLLPPAIPSAAAVTQAEIDALKGNASALAGQKAELAKQLKEIKADKSQAQAQKNLLERQINVVQEELTNLAAQIQMYQQLIQEKTAELEQTQEKEREQYALFCQRIRAMEEEGQSSYWAILFAASDFSGLLDSFIMVEEFIEYDNAVMNNLMAIRAQIEQEKADLEASMQAQEAAKAEQEAAKAELKRQEDEVDALISEIRAIESELQAQEAALRKAADAMNEEIRKKEKALAAQLANVVSESGFLWPLDSNYNTLSSLFGSRVHPLTGRANNHTGIDIPAPRNTKIYTAKSGVVITSGYNSSYGNYVVVSHGGGQSTLYAHMNSRAVSEGQTVSQGNVIGYVGTTGSSTGNHLHFEIRLDGNRVDPVNYFKDKALYVTSKGQTVKLNH